MVSKDTTRSRGFTDGKLSGSIKVIVSVISVTFLQIILLSSNQFVLVQGWGSDDDGGIKTNALFGDGLSRDWLYSASSISLQLEGCVWGYASDHDDAECMENGSQDGTTYWYQMANCRRAQAAYNLYSSSGGTTTCSTQNFKESFITTNGLATFLGYASGYDGEYDDGLSGAYDDDDGGDANNGNNNNNRYDNLPNCEQTNNGYVGLGCTDDGKFSLQYFSDSYCLTPTGKTYDKLSSLNKVLKTYNKCVGISSGAAQGNGNSLPELLIATSTSCSSMDSGFCSDSAAMQVRRTSAASSTSRQSRASIAEKSWVTKLKYATGGLLLLASFVMFTGILFTNRRRRRALMQRKYRQSRSERSRKSRTSKSRTRKGSRSKSRVREKESEAYYA